MNNSQFRRLLIDPSRQQDDGKTKEPAMGPPKAVLGARKHSSIPMTPRQASRGSVQADFARQLAERNAKANPLKKVKSSAPKGTKLAAGYIDRTKERTDEEDNEVAKRIKNLEESMKAGEINRDTFEKLVQDITDGDIGTTHLVKGLDRKLLERVRRGENVLESEQNKAEEDEAGDGSGVEDEFDALADENVDTIVRNKVDKRGVKVISPPPVVGVKRSRNDILKELKRQREEAAIALTAEHEKKYPTLGPGFRKVNANGETSRIEIDGKGREVLIITGPDGKEKRKVKKQKIEEQSAPDTQKIVEDAPKPTETLSLPPSKAEESGSEDDDIFEGVGSSYNPLANLEDSDDESEEEEEGEDRDSGERAPREKSSEVDPLPEGTSETAGPPTVRAKRDYFRSTNRGTASDKPSELSSADATVRAALAKVRNLDENSSLLQNLSTDPNDPNAKEGRLKKRAAELAASDRDMEDMDLGFGASRFDDAEEMEREGEKIKLSQWKGLGAEADDDDADQDGREVKKRKRGNKKRKGDKNSANDVLQAMERQKQAKTLG